MPATKLVCPHCEKNVEIQVSAVTRSRPCPECGEMVMLQMAEKSTKTKRRALLMTQAESETAAEPPPVTEDHEPQPLPGDAFERMRMDPEVRTFRRRLVIGGSLVAAVVVVLLAFSLYQSFQEKQEMRRLFGTDKIQDESLLPPNSPASASGTAMITPEETLPPVNAGNLVFRPTGSEKHKTATTQAGTDETSADLARLVAADEVLRQFLQAPNWKQRALLVRDQMRVAPLMSIYYGKNADGPVLFDSIVEAEEISPQFSEHVVVFEGGGRRLATVEYTASGPRVDWESFVGAGEMAWSDFLEARPAAPRLFRVLVSPAGHFENQFGDPATLQCLSLRCIAEPGAKVVYGYVARDSALAKELNYWLEQSSEATMPMILKLKFPPDAPVDFQVWIHQMVNAGWVSK